MSWFALQNKNHLDSGRSDGPAASFLLKEGRGFCIYPCAPARMALPLARIRRIAAEEQLVEILYSESRGLISFVPPDFQPVPI